MTTKTVEEVAPAVPDAQLREKVAGAQLTIKQLLIFTCAVVVGTVAVMSFIDSRMDAKLTPFREEVERFRVDMKEGLKDLQVEIRLLRDAKGNGKGG